MVKAFAQNVERVYFYLAHSVNVYVRILTSRLRDPSCPLHPHAKRARRAIHDATTRWYCDGTSLP